MSRLPAILLTLLILLAATACREEKKEVLSGKIDPEKFPTMMTRNVETLISDSGVTRYRITSPLWLVFDESREPYWNFPHKLHLEKYDDLLRVDATVDADSAHYFKNQQLWRLDGNVRIANMLKEKFLTQQLYWDQRNRKIYSDSFIHIEKSDRIIEGYGFVSDEQMTNYTVKNVAGIFPVSEEGPLGQSGSASAPQAASPAPDAALPPPDTASARMRPPRRSSLRPATNTADPLQTLQPATAQ